MYMITKVGSLKSLLLPSISATVICEFHCATINLSIGAQIHIHVYSVRSRGSRSNTAYIHCIHRHQNERFIMTWKSASQVFNKNLNYNSGYIAQNVSKLQARPFLVVNGTGLQSTK